ncbi:MAG TPA: hypothetical protein VFD58_30885 [Blastocatellia bacterium]|nr:hypothetical protein [Blastocatellia bacterium]
MKNFSWTKALLDEEVNKIWNQLYRLVYLHPLVQSSRNAGMMGAGQYSGETYNDLTQELFLMLFQKGRFHHYIETEMTDSEIEHEIAQIELTNMLVAHLRRQYPESYRMARRISTLIQNNPRFRRFDTLMMRETKNPRRRRGLTEQVYGLAEWPDNKELKERALLEELVQQVPMRKRNTREAGCTADSQIIISNADMLDLIVEVLEAVDSLVDVKTIRTLVMSRLPVINIVMVPISRPDDDNANNTPFLLEVPDGRENPEENLLNHEFSRSAIQLAEDFLDKLALSVRRKPKQSERMIHVLWHCYLDPGKMSNIQLAKILGVSDSLISDYCNRVNRQLNTLNLTIEQARVFEAALKRRTASLLGSAQKQVA